jgi:hypothetical protein
VSAPHEVQSWLASVTSLLLAVGFAARKVWGPEVKLVDVFAPEFFFVGEILADELELALAGFWEGDFLVSNTFAVDFLAGGGLPVPGLALVALADDFRPVDFAAADFSVERTI